MIPISQRNKDLRYYYRNKDKIRARRIKRRENPGFKEKEKAKNAENYVKNRERILGYKKKWSTLYPEKVKTAAKKSRIKRRDKIVNYELKKKYGISLAEYNAKLAEQNNCCAICGKKPENKRLPVDHDHKTGKNRGILCDGCNVSLGRFNDNIFLLKKAIKYLKKYVESN